MALQKKIPARRLKWMTPRTTMRTKPKKMANGGSVDLGARVKGLRKNGRFTLQELSSNSGLSISTLSKIENNKLSPTYETILRLAQGLKTDIALLFSNESPNTPRGLRSITRSKGGKIVRTSKYDYEMLCTDLIGKKMVPLKARVKARDKKDFGSLLSHAGEEAVYVISGTIELITEFYEPVLLEAGDCAYLDSNMGHMCISKSKEDAEVFWVCSSPEAASYLNGLRISHSVKTARRG